MIGSFIGSNRNDSALFKQVADNVSSFDGVVSSKKDLDVLSETAGVIVSYCFAVAESLK